MKSNERRSWRGLAVRREVWTLTLRARLLLLGLVAGAVIFLVLAAQPFFAVTHRVPASVLVIEGWSPPNAMQQAAKEFVTGHYKQAVLVRPIINADDKHESGESAGDYLISVLIKYGVPPEKIASLFPEVARKDRTYHSALDVKKWLTQQGIKAESLDVITLGVHARRSRLLYEKAFGEGTKIGIVAMEDREYDKDHWWRSSAGVREVLGEAIAYVYARFFFRPAENS